MTLQERRAWIRLVTALAAYAAYAAVVLSSAGGRPLAQTAYAAALLWSCGGSIVAAMAIETGTGGGRRGGASSRVTDVRDREIGRLGDLVGSSFVVIGAGAAMLMAMASWERFWIANVIYLCFVLCVVLGNLTKVLMYRGSFPQW
jgi:hypothetical protein